MLQAKKHWSDKQLQGKAMKRDLTTGIGRTLGEVNNGAIILFIHA